MIISDAGVFIIETKNWSKKSFENEDLYSPFKQINRNGYAVYKILKRYTEKNKLIYLDKSYEKKSIPTRKIVVSTQFMPEEEHNYIKLLKPEDVIGYVKYFRPIYSREETEVITGFLLSINNRKINKHYY